MHRARGRAGPRRRARDRRRPGAARDRDRTHRRAARHRRGDARGHRSGALRQSEQAHRARLRSRSGFRPSASAAKTADAGRAARRERTAKTSATSARSPRPIRALIRNLLATGFFRSSRRSRSREDGQAYNVNADLAAGAIAAALRADAFVLVTNVSRVLRDVRMRRRASIAHRRPSLRFIATDACRSSMKPKLQSAAAAVANGAASAYICALKGGAIAAALAGDATIVRRL